MTITYEDEIPEPPEKIFPWLADPDKAVKWQKNVKCGRILYEDSGIIGTTFEETLEEDGKSLTMHGTITRYDEGRIIGFHLESRIHTVDVGYSLEGKGAGTRPAIEAVIRWKFPMNLVSKFLEKKIAENIRKQLEAEAGDPKSLCAG